MGRKQSIKAGEVHHVNIEAGKCSYCGSSGSVGSSCSKSPSRGHVRGLSQ